MGLQTTITAEQLVALCAIVLDPTVHLLVTEKVAPHRKYLRTQVAREMFWFLLGVNE